MKRISLTILCLALFCAGSALSLGEESKAEGAILPPQVEPKTPPAPLPKAAKPTPLKPLLLIPSINFQKEIIPVGVDRKGNMAVPSGKSDTVGWYKDGPKPGARGSAVIAAHVFAAFQRLDEVKVGDDIYTIDESGKTLHFKVFKVKTKKLADVSAEELFNSEGGRFLHLITCAGKLTKDRSTYTHRLLVYAELQK